MADCERLAGCDFFNDRLEHMPAVARVYKEIYCHADFANCARYQVARVLGKEGIPGDLFPNQVDRVDQIINAAGKEKPS